MFGPPLEILDKQCHCFSEDPGKEGHVMLRVELGVCLNTIFSLSPWNKFIKYWLTIITLRLDWPTLEKMFSLISYLATIKDVKKDIRFGSPARPKNLIYIRQIGKRKSLEICLMWVLWICKKMNLIKKWWLNEFQICQCSLKIHWTNCEIANTIYGLFEAH